MRCLFIHLSIFFAFLLVASVLCYYLVTSLLTCSFTSSPSPGLCTADYLSLCKMWHLTLQNCILFLLFFFPLIISPVSQACFEFQTCPPPFEDVCEFKSLFILHHQILNSISFGHNPGNAAHYTFHFGTDKVIL